MTDETPSEPPVVAQPTDTLPATESANSNTAVERKRARLVLTLIIGVVALLIGAAGGFAISASSTARDAPQIASLKSKLSDASSENATLTSQKASVEAEKSTLDAEKSTLASEKAKLDAATAALDANTFAGDGTFVVGTDIQPGTYKAPASPGCYWARLSGLDGSDDDIIANDNTDGPVVITIAPSDKAFNDARCGSFTKIG
jgi:flagellar basal body-associated protein FliL